jgi:hypothetical protein
METEMEIRVKISNANTLRAQTSAIKSSQLGSIFSIWTN